MRSALVLLLVASGCVTEIDTEHPASRIGHVVADCVVPLPDRGAPVGLEYDDASLWIFGDGTGVLVPDVASACRGAVTTLPAPVVALTDAEVQANQTRTDGRALAVRPRGGFVAGGVGTLYYDLVLQGPGVFDEEPVGTGVCTLADRTSPCVRSPDFLWTGEARAWGDGAWLEPDGTAALLGCAHPAPFDDLCGVAQVAPADAADPTAYQYAGWSGWVAHPRDALDEFGAPAAVTGSRVLDRVGVTVADIWQSRLELRVADTPSGPYGPPLVLFDVPSPSDWFFSGGHEHAALRGDGGRTLAFSYATTASGAAGLHLVSFQLDGEALP